LRRQIVADIFGQRRQIHGFGLGSELAGLLLGALGSAESSSSRIALDNFPLDPNVLTQLQLNMPATREQMKHQGLPPLLLVIPRLRAILARYARLFAPVLAVLSYIEIPDGREVILVGTLGCAAPRSVSIESIPPHAPCRRAPAWTFVALVCAPHVRRVRASTKHEYGPQEGVAGGDDDTSARAQTGSGPSGPPGGPAPAPARVPRTRRRPGPPPRATGQAAPLFPASPCRCTAVEAPHARCNPRRHHRPGHHRGRLAGEGRFQERRPPRGKRLHPD